MGSSCSVAGEVHDATQPKTSDPGAPQPLDRQRATHSFTGSQQTTAMTVEHRSHQELDLHRHEAVSSHSHDMEDRDGADDLDDLLERDDDPPIVDDESIPRDSLGRLVSDRRSKCQSSAMSVHSARKSVVSFSESVSVHYDHTGDDAAAADEDAATRRYDDEDVEDGDEEGEAPVPLPGRHQADDIDDLRNSKPGELMSSFELESLSTAADPATESFTRRRNMLNPNAASSSMINADVCSVTSRASSRGQVVTVALVSDGGCHREQLAMRRL